MLLMDKRRTSSFQVAHETARYLFLVVLLPTCEYDLALRVLRLFLLFHLTKLPQNSSNIFLTSP